MSVDNFKLNTPAEARAFEAGIWFSEMPVSTVVKRTNLTVYDQFGRPIGSFQAVKHKCADMLVQVELAEAASREAARLADEGSADFPVSAAVAHACCSRAYMFAAMENIQVHGGIGFTWEHPAHMYCRRAKSSQLLFGGPAVYHER